MNEFTITHQPTIMLRGARCHECRRFYAYESVDNARCPHCATATVRRLSDQIEKLERSNASLRGALRRKTKR